MRTKKAVAFYSDLYRQNFYFLKGWTREQFERTLGVSTCNAGGITLYKDGIIYIWVDKLDAEGLSELVHECVHACNFTFEQRGLKISARNDEAQAYFVQWIFNHCFQSIKKSWK